MVKPLEEENSDIITPIDGWYGEWAPITQEFTKEMAHEYLELWKKVFWIKWAHLELEMEHEDWIERGPNSCRFEGGTLGYKMKLRGWEE